MKTETMFYTTFKEQIELLPRITVLYGERTRKAIGFEWLWFGVFIDFKKK